MKVFPNGNLARQTNRCVLRGAVCLAVFVSSASGSVHTLLPFEAESYEEYDHTILDPLSGSGAPYGGYSRATRSRLAKLPLIVPDLVEDVDGARQKATKKQNEQEDPFYMEMTDSEGQRFICRLYHEDELEPQSLTESMFMPPRLIRQEISPQVRTESEEESQALEAEESTTPPSRQLPQFEGEDGISEAGSSSGSGVKFTPQLSSTAPTEPQPLLVPVSEMAALNLENKIVHVQVQLSDLDGLCVQLHSTGWWSYEWCYRTSVSQFHIKIERTQSANAQVSVEAVSSLGNFHSRTTLVENLHKLPKNKYLDGKREIGRVVDEYRDGAFCGETGKRRKTFAHLMCCGDKHLDKSRDMLHRDGVKLDTKIAALLEIEEKPTCSYNVTICTPLLCDTKLNKGAPSGGGVSSAKRGTSQRRVLMPASKFPVGSIRYILSQALNKCIQTETEGWWSYEYCHGKQIRQFHEEIATQKTSAGAIIMSKTLETEHILGHYNAEIAEAYPQEDWRFVTNMTSAAKGEPHAYGKGNGAYFEIEYTGGELCDHSDVADSAIVAGSAGVGGVERASSVRFSCGGVPSVVVNEDSTCHYIVHVRVPELCDHPLFMAPVSKKQVVKCLPV